jgi:hypothetical protein
MKRISYLIISAFCFVLIIAALMLQGCAFSHPVGNPGHMYDQRFQDWLQRQQKEGWNADLIGDIISGCQYVGEYVTEKQDGVTDHWMTYGEFVRNNFEGDCDDFVAFEAGTLRKLGYHHKLWWIIIGMPLGNHCQLEVELPDGSTKIYESISTAFPIIMSMIDPIAFLNYALPARLVGRYEITM